MLKLTVSEKEINVNGFIVSSIDIPEISYSYLYYEPDAENTFRVIPVDDAFQQVDLTEEEIAVCKAYCEAFDSTPYEVEVIDTSAEEQPVDNVLVVDSSGRWKGEMPASKMEAGDNIVDTIEGMPKQPSNTLFFPANSFTWNGTEWILTSITDKRRFEQLTQTSVTDQLDFLLKAIDALSNGDALPEDVQGFISQWKEIKANNAGG